MMRIFAGLLAGALVLASCSAGSDAVDQTAGGEYRYVAATSKGSVIPVAQRQPAGQVTGPLLTGGTYRLAQDAGKTVVVNFWGSWCGPCQIETPAFDKLYRDVKGSGVQFVGMDVKETSQDAPKAFVRDNDITYPIVYDPDAKTALELGHIPQTGLPVTVIVDKQQRVAAVYLGQVQPADIQNALTALS
jgi:thiol-disulfide isomerase/thioredoxin